MQGRMGQQAEHLVVMYPPPQRERAAPPAPEIHQLTLASALFHVSLRCQYPDFVAWGSFASSVGNLVILGKLSFPWGFPGGTVIKNLPANAGDTRHKFNAWIGKIPWRRAWPPTPVCLLGESQGQRKLGLQSMG